MDNLIPIIITSGGHGRAVLYGRAKALPKPGEVVELHGARMVLRWDSECGGLLGLAAKGPTGDTRITESVKLLHDTVKQAMTVSPEAASAIDAWGAA